MRDFFEPVAWTGSGIAWSLSVTGLLVSRPASTATSSFSFVQISDSRSVEVIPGVAARVADRSLG
jgi:hypothetical protein